MLCKPKLIEESKTAFVDNQYNVMNLLKFYFLFPYNSGSFRGLERIKSVFLTAFIRKVSQNSFGRRKEK